MALGSFKMFPTRLEVDAFFEKLGRQWHLEVSETVFELETCLGPGAKYTLTKGCKKVVFQWEIRRPEEMWYLLINNDVYEWDGWTEVFPSEEISVHFDYLEEISTRYLESPTRISKKWKGLSRREILGVPRKWEVD